MNKFFMIVVMIAVAMLTFTACSDDSGSNSTDVSVTNSIIIDEATQTLAMVNDDETEACVVENSNFVWKTGHVVGLDTTNYKYFFLSDTLVLQQCTTDGYCEFGLMFLGGSAGSIYGKWRMIDCRYGVSGTECSDRYNYGYPLYFEFSENSVRFSAELSAVQAAYENTFSLPVMQSNFVYDMIRCLTGMSCNTLYASNLADEFTDEVNEIVESKAVQIISTSQRAADLIISGQTVSVRVNQASKNIDDKDNSESAVNVTVSANGNLCTLDYYSTDRNLKSYCSYENIKNFEMGFYYDEAGVEVFYVSRFTKTNEHEFTSCVQGLLSSTVSESMVLSKKTADNGKKALCEEIRKTQERFMMQVIKANTIE